MNQHLITSFHNPQVNELLLPQVEDLELHPLKSTYRWVLVGSQFCLMGILWIVLLLVVIFGQLWSFAYIWWIVFGLFVISTTSVVFSYISFDKKGWAIREEDIFYKTGLFWKTEFLVPFHRVQHVEVKKGPLDELFETAKIKIFTAGGNSSDLTIPGLEPSIAQRVRNHILKKQDFYSEEE